MSANPSYWGAATSSADDPRSIDELDVAIRTLAREMNAETYRMLMLVREFDDRCGWQKWGLRSCAEWLAWRCDLSLSTAREKVRTAQALREMPAITAAFADGRLSYSKVRALTRVVEYHDEDSLLDYALRVTAPQVEDRCREIRNAAPESRGAAWRAWEHRSLIVSRDPSRGMLKITVEVPIEDGEVIAKAIERVADGGDAAIGLEFAAARKAAGVRDSSEASANGWRAQQADALLAMAKASLAGSVGGGAVGAGVEVTGAHAGTPGASDAHSASISAADHYQVVLHVDESALRGGIGRSDLPIDTVKRLTCDGSVVTIVEDDRGTPLDVGRKQRLANLLLLCSHHHRLVHEGGFAIRRDRDAGAYFVRPDGRVIPRCGYRVEDRVDDFAEGSENPSVEGWRPPAVCDPSAEVRETRAVYRIACRARPSGPALWRSPAVPAS